ncbi:hypothetical protein TRFO_32855 [Tritrichomonas foetus]|uniref:Protein kinase domain-containing protein n=1 Tax=Tritrichomonas foetus TaxID=1144522 RepID=A0A1J4JNZ5_9EUKA|nr:hypothetical protein TRFO_32855 [Tritrichomonas foetus]|eukprot:OHT00450.1 hypothetical protein TRFO_32855 [Tritrichomonas foetus]
MSTLYQNGVTYRLNLSMNTAIVVQSPDAEGDITIPRSVYILTNEFIVKEIGQCSFENNRNLYSLFFDSDSEVEIIRENAFRNSSIKNIMFSPKLKKLERAWCAGSYSLSSVIVSQLNKYFVSERGAVLSKSREKLYFVSRNQPSYTVSNTVRKICSFAFNGSNIGNISFKNNSILENIKESAFEMCKNIKSLSLPPSIRYLRYRAFRSSGCETITSDTESIEICAECFRECRLKVLSLPKMRNLSINRRTFLDISENFKLVIPEGISNPILKQIQNFDKPIKVEYIKTNNISYIPQTSQFKPFTPISQPIKPLNMHNKYEDCELPEDNHSLKDRKAEFKKIGEYENRIQELIKENQRLIKENKDNKILKKEIESKEELLNKIQFLTHENEKLRNKLEYIFKQVKQTKENERNRRNLFDSEDYDEPFTNINNTIICFHQEPTMVISNEEISKCRKIEKIGEGATSKVVKVALEKEHKIVENQIFALKIFKNFKNFTFRDQQNFVREIEIMSNLHHPCILKIHGFNFGFDNNETDHLTGKSKIKNKKKCYPSILLSYQPTTLAEEIESLTNTEKVISILEIVLGMRYIQEKCHLIHRDLKPNNILMNSKHHIRISDFGVTTETERSSLMTKGVGTFQYMAPEILNEEDNYNEKVDQYSFGIVLFFILMNGKLPKFKMSEVSTGKLFPIPNSLPKFAQNLIINCCSFSPVERPTFSSILSTITNNNYSFFDDVDFTAIKNRHSYLLIKESLTK